MRISIFGSGYVGLVQAAVFADVGHRVICMDIDADRVERLQRGEVPFFEPGLSEMVIRGVQGGLLTFTTDTKASVESSEFLFICVGTPPRDDDSPDLQYLMSVADGIAEHINGRKVVINKSTDKGPRVVSPPTKGKLYSWQARASPCESPCSHKSSTEGRVSASVMPSGSAPIAAKSLTADATAL